MNEEYIKNQKRLFIKDLEKLLKVWGINNIKEMWLSANQEYLTIKYFGGHDRAIRVARSSLTQIIKDIVVQGGLN